MNKIERITLYFFMAATTLVLAWVIISKNNKIDTVYVDMGKLLGEYKFKQDLDKKAEAGVQRLKSFSDSLDVANKVNPGMGLDTQSMKVKYALEKYYEKASQSINKQVFERLNPLFIEYGKEKKLKLILGAVGNGVILYGDKETDITEDLTKYINVKYESGK